MSALTILRCDDCFGALTVNGVLLNDDWVCAYDLAPLLDDADLRGGDRLIPHATGVVAYARRRTVPRIDLPLWIAGPPRWDGVPQSDTPMGLVTNVEYLRVNLGIASQAGDGTVVASWARPDGTTRTAAVHVISPLRVRPRNREFAQAVLTLSLPNGRFT